MKKISKKNLKAMREKGWSVSSVTKPKQKAAPKTEPKVAPKTEPKPPTIDATNRAIADMAIVVKAGFSKDVVVKMPNDRKKEWKFAVKRDKKGFIQEVTAKEM